VKLLLLGMNHRTAPVELRERYAVDDPRPSLDKLQSDAEIEEAVLLSTCNRVEAVVLTREPDAARLRMRAFFERELARDAGRNDGLDEALYELADGEAVAHVLRVACSVDSLVVGEPQILGQVKDAYRSAVECGACGPILSRLYQRAFATAKRVRTETGIAERPVSVARVAVDLAKEIFESLEDKTALLIGAGEMTELALETLRSQGLSRVRVANRTRANAVDLAARFEADAHGLDDLPALLSVADVVLASIGSEEPVVTAPMLRTALRGRRHRPIFVIDIGVPRNVDPAIDELDNVYLYDLDDLSGVAEENAAGRRAEVERAERIVLEEVRRFEGWLTALSAVPTIRTLRARAEAIRKRELERAMARNGLADSEREAVEALTRSIVNKILHAPISRLREELEREEGLAHLEAARALFALDDPDAPGADADPADAPRDRPARRPEPEDA